MVFQRSMLDWRRQGAVNLQWVYVHCAIYMCVCNVCGIMVFQRSILDWRRGWGQSAIGICALCHICQVWCNSVQGIYAQLTGGSIHHRSMLHHYISPLSIYHRSMLHHYTPFQSTIGPCYTIIPHKSAQGICALCYI